MAAQNKQARMSQPRTRKTPPKESLNGGPPLRLHTLQLLDIELELLSTLLRNATIPGGLQKQVAGSIEGKVEQLIAAVQQAEPEEQSG